MIAKVVEAAAGGTAAASVGDVKRGAEQRPYTPERPRRKAAPALSITRRRGVSRPWVVRIRGRDLPASSRELVNVRLFRRRHEIDLPADLADESEWLRAIGLALLAVEFE